MSAGARRWWKWIGLAGAAGVVAAGAVVARRERTRRSYSPEQIRARLHERYAAAAGLERTDRSAGS
ncbi:MAG TPA: hypothetical protein P5181_12325 [Dermatophilaceae bacterium]|nr:hypothetical protein [Dermatophilaceae bacterium]